MNQPLKQVLRIGGVVIGLGAAVWALRDKLLPAPEIPEGPPPRFRTGTGDAGADGSGTADDLTEVKGIGPVYSERLAEAGVTSFAELAAADVAAVAGAAGVSESVAASWMEQAADHT
jgi:predicted flap endonuclease-1-like 5' DNA nuclease